MKTIIISVIIATITTLTVQPFIYGVIDSIRGKWKEKK